MVLASSGGGWFGVVGGIVSGLVMLCVDVMWCDVVCKSGQCRCSLGVSCCTVEYALRC